MEGGTALTLYDVLVKHKASADRRARNGPDTTFCSRVTSDINDMV